MRPPPRGGQGAVREVVQRPLAAARLVDAADRRPRLAVRGRARPRCAKNVALEAESSRPTTVSSPSRRSRTAVAARAPAPAGPPARRPPSRRPRQGRALPGCSAAASRPPSVSVHEPVAAGADVALGIERLAAERAGRPAGGHDLERPRRERQDAPGREVTRTRSASSSSSSSSSSSASALPSGASSSAASSSLSSSSRASTITVSSSPSQTMAMVPTRKVSCIGSSSGARSMSSCGRLLGHVGSALADLGQQGRRAVRPATATWTFSRTTDTIRSPVAGLQVEGPAARLADGAGNEPIGIVEVVDASSHLASGSGARAHTPNLYRLAPPPHAAKAQGAPRDPPARQRSRGRLGRPGVLPVPGFDPSGPAFRDAVTHKMASDNLTNRKCAMP